MKLSLRKLKYSRMGMLMFLLAMYTVGTISAIRVSWTLTLALLALSCILIGFSFAVLRCKRICNLTLVWLILTLLCIVGTVRSGGSAIVAVFYMLCLLILLMSNIIGIDAVYHSLRWIKFFGLFFAFGCYWQYLFPDQYYAKLYPLFGTVYQQSIRRQFTFHKMCTGFTSQTAVAAQFIVLGIMATLYLYARRNTLKSRIISIVEMIFLFGGLLLTGKRSPLLNLAAAVIVVDMITVKRSKRGNRVLAVILGIIVALTVLYFCAPFFSNSRNSLIRLFQYSSVGDANDSTNGRLTLYASAISEFLEHPILGIGWGGFSQIYDATGVHNIYLQLLCECGVIGFLFASVGMLAAVWKSIKMLKRTAKAAHNPIAILMKCSVFIQIYTLVYGIFGNPLYDQNYIMMYFMGLLMYAVCYFNSGVRPGRAIKQKMV